MGRTYLWKDSIIIFIQNLGTASISCLSILPIIGLLLGLSSDYVQLFVPFF